MADKKISALPAATTPLSGTEVLPIVQGGVTDQVSVNNLTAGRTVPATRLSMPTGSHTMYVGFDGATDAMQIATQTEINLQTGAGYGMAVNIDSSHNVNVSQGNVKLSTAGKGIDFSANTHAAGMTSELLTWYEEGTWTPTFNSFTLNGTQTVHTATYTRIGRLVFLQATFSNSLTQSASGGTSYIDGLPFGASVSGTIMFMNEATAASIGVGEVYAANDRLYPPSFSTAVANDVILMSGCYIV